MNTNYGTYNWKKLLPKKRYSCLAGYFFWRVQITTIKIMTKKKYIHLADGWNKSQITVCRVKIRTPIITKPGIITTEKKGTVVSSHWLEHKTQNTTLTDTTTNMMRCAPLPSSGFAPSLSMGRAVAPPNHGAAAPQCHVQATTRQGCACCVFDSYLFFLPVVIFSGRTIWCSYFDTYSNWPPHDCTFFFWSYFFWW